MPEAFVIMQIGNPEMDSIYKEVIAAAIVGAKLTPRRVDVHNTGGLLQNEIASFIERAEIVVADLTYERPNCYLEVGYAIGLGKLRSLILTARRDHNPTGRHHVANGPRVHFDLSSYDVLYWNPADLGTFKSDLQTRIERRRAILPTSSSADPWDSEWLAVQRDRAQAGLMNHE